ncbi:hypothetical protein E2320_019910 [Naja naja]|nr:hypothetical protein E2320_019910 [Naja naja]
MSMLNRHHLQKREIIREKYQHSPPEGSLFHLLQWSLLKGTMDKGLALYSLLLFILLLLPFQIILKNCILMGGISAFGITASLKGPWKWGPQEEWYHRKAYTTLLSSLDAKLYPSIPDGLTAGEVWGLLYSLFNSDSLGSTTRLTSEFYNTKLRFGASMAEHLGKLKALRAELVLRDYPVTEANMIAVILASLDRSWGNFIVSLEGTRKEAMTLSYLTGRLNEEDRRHRDAGEYTRATTHCTSRRHQDSEQVNALLKCFICGSEEHLKKDCPHHQQGPKHGSKQKRGKGERRGHGRGKGGANGNFVCNCYLTPTTGLWLLDSGASSHIANLRQDPATNKSKEQDEEVSLPGPEGEDEPSSPEREDTPSSPDSLPPTTPQRPVMPST